MKRIYFFDPHSTIILAPLKLQKCTNPTERRVHQSKATLQLQHVDREASPFEPGDAAFIKDLQRSGEVLAKHPDLRSFITVWSGATEYI